MIAADKDWVPEIGPATANAASIADGWRSRLLKSDTGKTIPCLANAITALRHAPEWDGVIAFDEFALRTVARKSPPWAGEKGGWTDNHDRHAAAWFQRNGIFVKVRDAGDAVQAVARDNVFHPVREYLDSLEWDGVRRIGGWLSLYLGAEQTHYSTAVGERFLTSAVARIYRPGVKADSLLIFEGRQGLKKSQAARVLGEPWFSDEVSDIRNKDATMQLHGVWIVELAELDALRLSDVARIKSFISRQTDHYRPPYGHRVIDVDRQCVFVGTGNRFDWHKDETGGRRFWPIRCAEEIDIEKLRDAKDQLWAEAAVRFRSGAPWWLETAELNRKAEREQEDRYDGDVWDALVMPWAEDRLKAGVDSVSVGEVLELCIGKSKDRWERGDQMRVGRCLVAGRWERYRDRKRGMEWRYRPNVPTEAAEVGTNA